FAETGHLVLCTLHANNANQAMDRIINFFPEDRRDQLLMDLSLNLKGVVAQQLIPTPDGKGRRVAMEVLLGTPLVQDYIRDGEVHKLKEVMKESTQLGMQTFDQALFALYQAGEISYDDALRFADSQNEVRLRIKLAQGGDANTLSAGLDGVEVAELRWSRRPRPPPAAPAGTWKRSRSRVPGARRPGGRDPRSRPGTRPGSGGAWRARSPVLPCRRSPATPGRTWPGPGHARAAPAPAPRGSRPGSSARPGPRPPLPVRATRRPRRCPRPARCPWRAYSEGASLKTAQNCPSVLTAVK